MECLNGLPPCRGSQQPMQPEGPWSRRGTRTAVVCPARGPEPGGHARLADAETSIAIPAHTRVVVSFASAPQGATRAVRVSREAGGVDVVGQSRDGLRGTCDSTAVAGILQPSERHRP